MADQYNPLSRLGSSFRFHDKMTVYFYEWAEGHRRRVLGEIVREKWNIFQRNRITSYPPDSGV